MSVVVEQVARKLGGSAVLGETVRSEAELARAVARRLPLATLGALTAAGIGDREIERLVIPQRTRRHRAAKEQSLTIDESDRVVRILRVQTIAETTFADETKARAWLRRPLAALGGKAPLDLAETEVGARAVEGLLARIAWGAAA